MNDSRQTTLVGRALAAAALSAAVTLVLVAIALSLDPWISRSVIWGHHGHVRYHLVVFYQVATFLLGTCAASVWWWSFSRGRPQSGRATRPIVLLPNWKISAMIMCLIVCATLFAFGWYVWPTPYTYHDITYQRAGYTRQEVHRINRFTGQSHKVLDSHPSSR